MFNFTYQNHLKYNIGGREFGFRQNDYEKYNVTIGKVDHIQYKKGNYQKELLKIVDLIYTDLGKDIILFLSGGTDSEIVLRSFINYGYIPRCFIVRLKENYNANDVNEAVILCKELDVKLDILDFDVKEFYYSGEANEFGKKVQCTQITYLMIYYHILKLSSPSVMGGELLLSRKINKNSNFWYYTFRENEDASAMRFSIKYNIPLVNEFFSYTPEIMLYFLKSNAGVSEMLANPYKLTSVSSKNDILQRLYPTVRKKEKTHGFEKLLAFNYEAYKNIATSYRRLEDSLDGIPLDQTLQMLQENYDKNFE